MCEWWAVSSCRGDLSKKGGPLRIFVLWNGIWKWKDKGDDASSSSAYWAELREPPSIVQLHHQVVRRKVQGLRVQGRLNILYLCFHEIMMCHLWCDLKPVSVGEIVELTALQRASTLVRQLLVKRCLIVTCSRSHFFSLLLNSPAHLSWSRGRSPHHTPPAPCWCCHSHSWTGCPHSWPEGLHAEYRTVVVWAGNKPSQSLKTHYSNHPVHPF